MTSGQFTKALRYALLLTAASVALHVVALTRAGALWRDEVNTIQVSTRPTLQEAWRAEPYEAFPMLPFCAVRLWAGLVGTQNDFGLRIFGLLMGLGLLAVLWLSAWQAGGNVPIWSVVLLGFNPAVIRWGDSLRAYGLGTLLIVLTFGLVWRVIESPTRKRIVWAALAGLLSVQSLYNNAFLLAGICVAGALLSAVGRDWKKAVLILLLGLPAALSLLPYLGVIQQAGMVDLAVQQTFVARRIWGVFYLTAGQPYLFVTWIWIGLSLLALAGAVLLSLPGMARWREQRLRAFYGGATLLGSVLAFAVFFLILGRQTSTWYYLPLLGVWAVSLDMILSALAEVFESEPRLAGARAWRAQICFRGRPLPMQWVGAGSLAAILFIPTGNGIWPEMTDMDWLGRRLEKSAAKGDLILVNPWYYGVSFNRYYHGAAQWKTVPPLADVSIHRFDLVRQQMISDPTTAVRELTGAIARTLQAGHRVWLVGGLEEPKGLPVLNPAPANPAEWKNGLSLFAFYSHAWAAHAGHFIETHGRNSTYLGPDWRIEHVPMEPPQLTVWEGWKD